MSTTTYFSWRNKKTISTFQMEKKYSRTSKAQASFGKLVRAKGGLGH